MSNAEITVIGNITADPEMKFTPNGNARLSFSVASNRRYQANGEWQEETSFFNVCAWRYTAENAANVLEKGMPVVVKGRLEQRSWEDTEGQKRSTVEIVADHIAVSCNGIETMTRRRGNGQGGSAPQGRSNQAPQRRATVPASDPFDDF